MVAKLMLTLVYIKFTVVNIVTTKIPYFCYYGIMVTMVTMVLAAIVIKNKTILALYDVQIICCDVNNILLTIQCYICTIQWLPW